jgi:integrase
MKKSQDMNRFQEYLEKNTNLAQSSIILYIRCIKGYLFKYNNSILIEDFNDYISQGYRFGNNTYIRYAVKHYLDYINKPKLIKDLFKTKRKPRKKFGKYLSEEKIRSIIDNISNPLYQDIALLQFQTGSRAREIITLREENLDFDFKPGIIRIRIIGKGSKERIVYLSEDFKEILEKYLFFSDGYLFLDRELKSKDINAIEKAIHNLRTYYYIYLKKAAKKIGINNFSTHDFRRNVAQMLSSKNVNIRTIQKILGHADISTTAKYFDENVADVEKALIEHQRGL